MTRERHDQFAKALLKSLLEPLGRVTRHFEVPAESLHVDVVFEGVDPSVEPEDLERFGFLGRLVDQPCLFEPYRSPLQDAHLLTAMAKLTWSRLEHLRRKKQKSKQPTHESPPLLPPRLWILTPNATQGRLRAHALSPAAELNGHPPDPQWWERRLWPSGVYMNGTAWGFGVIVLNELPIQRETLLLRLLGKGQTQLEALEQVRRLPTDDPLRKPVLHLIHKWRILFREAPSATREEREVTMLIDTFYDEWHNRARNEGRNEGQLEGLRVALRRAWRKRFGDLPPQVDADLERLSTLEALEAGIDALIVAQSAQDAERALNLLSPQLEV